MRCIRFGSAVAASVVALLFAAASLAAPDVQEKEHKPPAAAQKLEPYECGKVQRLHTLGGVFLASQPQPDDFKTAQEAGIKTVVNLRQPDETDWDEAAHIKKLGMEYHNIPFKAPKTLTDDVFVDVRKLLNDTSKRPMIVHCSSANRVGAVWLAHRVLDGGLSYGDALAEAKTVGLKLPAYEEQAKDYIERQQK